jgi:CRISPR-associated protein (TIGR02710 family)
MDTLATPSDPQLDTRHQEAVARLHGAPTADEARAIYKAEVFPLEEERVRREADRRGRDGDPRLDLLFLTVGAQSDSPFLASVATPAEFLVLLHTDRSRTAATEVVDRLGISAAKGQLHEVGDGKNPNLLYATVFDTWNERRRPARVGVDLTGGLKTMSAGAAAAGFALPGGRVFYIEADQPRIHGVPFWINEHRIELGNPFRTFGEIRRDSARALLAAGRFGPAAAAFEDLYRHAGFESDRMPAQLAAGYDAIERLEFSRATSCLAEVVAGLDRRRDQGGSDVSSLAEHARHIRGNLEGAQALAVFQARCQGGTETPLEALHAAEYLDFIAVLLASARRREAEGLHDIAALLGYRALEAIVQRRFALRSGMMSGTVDWALLPARCGRSTDEIVSDYNRATKQVEHRLDATAPRTEFPSAATYTLLAAAFPDDVARQSEIQKFAGLGRTRNKSLLAHGFRNLEPSGIKALLDYGEILFERLMDVERVADGTRRALRARHEFVQIAS